LDAMTKIEIIITQNNLIKLTNVWSTFNFYFQL